MGAKSIGRQSKVHPLELEGEEGLRRESEKGDSNIKDGDKRKKSKLPIVFDDQILQKNTEVEKGSVSSQSMENSRQNSPSRESDIVQ